jgi:hypothetical protein
MYVYSGSGWQAAGSSVNGTSDRVTYTATSGQTVFAVTYDVGYVDVYLNGVKLLAGTDFTGTNGTSITLASGATAGDIVDIVAYGTFVLADHYTEAQSDARYVQQTHTGNVDITGDLDVTGTVVSDGLTVDTDTLHVDAANNRVGIGTISPARPLHVTGTTNAFIRIEDRDSNADTDQLIGGLEIYGADANPAAFFAFISNANRDLDITNRTTTGGIDLKTNNTQALRIDVGGDISFYEDTGTTAKFFWDASAESLGIGTSSPASALEVSASEPYITVSSTASQAGTALGGIRFDTIDPSYAAGGYPAYITAQDLSANGSAFGLIFGTQNTERVRITNTGNVGIGTTSPSATLHVNKGTNAASAFPSGNWAAKVFNQTDATAENGLVVANRWASISSTAFEVGGLYDNGDGFDTFLKVDGIGNVGIGTTNPGQLLHLASSDPRINIEDTDAGGIFQIRNTSGVAYISTLGTHSMIFATDSLERMRIVGSTGNVGIGTSSPHSLLNVQGSGTTGGVLTLENSNTGISAGNEFGSIEFYSNDASSGASGVRARIAAEATATNAPTDITFSNTVGADTTVVERMRIDSSGNLLVGKTSSALSSVGQQLQAGGRTMLTRDGNQVLDINRLTSDGDIVRFYKDGSTVGIIGTASGNLTVTSAAELRFFTSSSNEDMRLETDGDLHVDGDVIAFSTTISDPRLKTDIQKIEGALDKLCTLSGYTFTYTPDGKASAGVLSTEVAEVLPSAIRPKKLPLKTGDEETVYDTVQYDQLHGLLIEAIKELREEVADLKAKIEG